MIYPHTTPTVTTVLAILLAGTALTCPGAAFAQAVWDGSEGTDYNDPGNWSTNTAPTDSIFVRIDTLTNAPVIGSGQTGVARSMAVGDQGSGQITVREGGRLVVGTTVNGGGLSVGGALSSNGTVRATGVGSSITVNGTVDVAVSQNSIGLVEILDGARLSSLVSQIGTAAGSRGTVTVSGAGSRWDTGNSGLFLGSLANPTARGTLNVLDGGAVVFAGANASLTANNGSAINVTGANSLLRLSGALTARNGTITVASGGAAESGSLSINGFAGLPDALVRVDGGTVTLSGVVSIGSSNDSTGALSITNGGTVRSGRYLLGFGGRSDSQLIVDGAGSLFELTASGTFSAVGGEGPTPAGRDHRPQWRAV